MDKNEKAKYAAKARVFKALAHPTRLWMAERLVGGERCVCEFVNAADLDFSTISKHLTVLRQAGIVEDQRRGKQVFYRLKVPCILQFVKCVEAVLEAERSAGVPACAGRGECQTPAGAACLRCEAI